MLAPCGNGLLSCDLQVLPEPLESQGVGAIQEVLELSCLVQNLHFLQEILRVSHFFRFDPTLSLQKRHQARLFPQIGVDPSVRAFGKNARDILQQTASGDMRKQVI